MAKEKAITVEQLHAACEAQMKAGNGKRRILLSGDDEGNSYHELFYGFSLGMDFNEPFMACCLPFGVTAKDVAKKYIVLG